MSRETIAKVLKRLRQESGLSADQVGSKIGKSGKTVNAWENNRGQPDIEILIQLCGIYGVKDILSEFREEEADAVPESEIQRYLSALKSRPEMRMLFSLSENASKEDVEKAVAIIELLKNK